MTARYVSLWVVTILMAGCPQHVENPTSADYPCGTRMHQCQSKLCCWNSEDCGPDVPGCPEGACCANGLGASPDGGKATANHPQLAPGSDK